MSIASEVLKPQATQVRAAYVHVPFCVHRCGYCDFTVIAGRDDLIGAYLDCLGKELQTKLARPQLVDTLFLGGGTPSYLPPADLQTLLNLLHRWLPRKTGSEFSIECNPDGLTTERIELLAAAGINRVSLGVQSFQTAHLQTLERSHTPDQVQGVVHELRRAGCTNISLDLIFGVPGQTLSEWEETLAAAVALEPRHISTYGLTYEKGTSFWSRLQKDQIRPVPEELERDMYALAMTRLPECGYLQYELSNFAQPGFECRHNQVYWRAEPYFGFGPGAAEFLNGERRVNHRSVTGWIHRIEQGQSPTQEVEQLDDDLLSREAVMVGLRQTVGIPLAGYRTRYGHEVRDLAPQAYDRFLADGLLEEAEGRVQLTFSGRFLADSVMAEFF
ncbi:radical SAM family heme chaperone HemW [Planctomicrobium piriforme]|uniref:Heme chaperone HemW n=1 Tax=Planctomicrobium piriforme TaxID=1576369 RepID=A0A1I3S781_9PLAN|nr:radical SAM family heme chaperone HemW [Planctomicrobium piriforme]SFJ54674.1 oxygen-independent coproporphyrinogen-3 oxidase [Planctomicrobium piriforme]